MRSVHLHSRPANLPPRSPSPAPARPPPPARPSRLFARFYTDHRSFVRGILLRWGVAARDVEDVLQEVFIVAWRRWDMLDAAEPRCWLFVVAIRQASNYRQLARHRVEFSMHEPPESVAPSFEPESIDASRRLTRLLRRLGPKHREVFVRHALRGESIQEIASALGRKPKTVYARLRAARDHLARLVA